MSESTGDTLAGQSRAAPIPACERIDWLTDNQTFQLGGDREERKATTMMQLMRQWVTAVQGVLGRWLDAVDRGRFANADAMLAHTTQGLGVYGVAWGVSGSPGVGLAAALIYGAGIEVVQFVVNDGRHLMLVDRVVDTWERGVVAVPLFVFAVGPWWWGVGTVALWVAGEVATQGLRDMQRGA